MDSRLADLERRVARAERQARALAGLALVAMSGGTLMLAARTAETRSPGSTVRAPFRVVDARGNALLVVDTGEWNDHWDAPGGTRLRLFDRNRRPTAVLMAAEDGGDLSLDREGGNRSIGLFAGGGGAALTFEPDLDEEDDLLPGARAARAAAAAAAPVAETSEATADEIAAELAREAAEAAELAEQPGS